MSYVSRPAPSDRGARSRGALALLASLALAMLAGSASASPPSSLVDTLGASGRHSDSTRVVSRQEMDRPDSLRAGDTITPEQLALALVPKSIHKPVVLQIGFKVLYRSGHIAHSWYVGPGSEPAGLDSLSSVLSGLERQQSIVLYCGCCPWSDCPNVRPAFRAARSLGFKSVKVLFVARNLQHDWIDKGFPMSEGYH